MNVTIALVRSIFGASGTVLVDGFPFKLDSTSANAIHGIMVTRTPRKVCCVVQGAWSSISFSSGSDCRSYKWFSLSFVSLDYTGHVVYYVHPYLTAGIVDQAGRIVVRRF